MLPSTNIQNSTFVSPKIINVKACEKENCVETRDNHNSEGQEKRPCKPSVRQDPDSFVSNKQRQAIIIADSPSPAVSVITISSDTDEDDVAQRHLAAK